MKCQNLHNLFGVVLRFKENKVAIIADVSTMYNRILIPGCYLWRDIEVDREPDVYIKPVLTFGNKTAPTMALKALRKTAKGAGNYHTYTSKGITDNTYMDDICE